MFYKLLTPSLLVFLLLSVGGVLCNTTNEVSSEPIAADSTEKNVDLLILKKQIALLKTNDGEATENVSFDNFYSPLLVATDDMMVALVGGNRTENTKTDIDILATYTEIEELNKITTEAKSDFEKKWKTQSVVHTKGNALDGVVKGMTVAANSKNIYIFLLNQTDNGQSWEYILAVGEADGTKQKMTWKVNKINDLFSTSKFQEKIGAYPSFSSGFLTPNKEIVFTFKGYSEKKNQGIFGIIKIKDEKTLDVLYIGENFNQCLPYIFPANNKLVMFYTNCEKLGNNMKVMESDDMGNSWKVSEGSTSRLLKFLKNNRYFTTANISAKTVVLFIQRKTNGLNDYSNHLWMTDGNRVIEIGAVLLKIRYTSLAFMLHTNNKLFLLYKKSTADYSQKENTIVLTTLQQQLTAITNVLENWKKSDAQILKLCEDTAKSKIPCTTDGLVGFLSGNSDNDKNKWEDKYLYVNATVTNGEIIDGGFKFNDVGAGAQWPVGKEEQDQPYNFTDPGFTLLATVIVEEVAKEKTNIGLVLGVGVSEENRNVWLLCGSDAKWVLSVGEDHVKKTSEAECNYGKEYQVELTLKKETINVYIDGERLKILSEENIKIQKTDKITNFYFGSASDKHKTVASYITVKNVLLYNKPFNDHESKEIKKGDVESDENNGSGNQISQERNNNENESLSPQLRDSGVHMSATAFIVVFILLLHVQLFI